jgi:hypothetical protein
MPTSFTLDFCLRASQFFESLDELLKESKGSQVVGHVKIGAPPLFGARVLEPEVKELFMTLRIAFIFLNLMMTQVALAFMARPTFQYPQVNQQPWSNNYNYWGNTWGSARPLYLYPNLPFYGLMQPPQYQNYYPAMGPSPYGPSSFCPTCSGIPLNQPVFN